MEPGVFQPHDGDPHVLFCEKHGMLLIKKTVESIVTKLPPEQPTASGFPSGA